MSPIKKSSSEEKPMEAMTPPTVVEPASVNESPAAPVAIPPQQLGEGDERTWGMLAHMTVLLNLVTGFAGPIAALIIYFVYRDRSRFIAYHALQAAIFQLIWWYGGGILIGLMWAIVGILTGILVGIVLIPFALIGTFLLLLLPLGALVYGVIGGVKISQNQDFKYWLVGDWVRGTLTGK